MIKPRFRLAFKVRSQEEAHILKEIALRLGYNYDGDNLITQSYPCYFINSFKEFSTLYTIIDIEQMNKLRLGIYSLVNNWECKLAEALLTMQKGEEFHVGEWVTNTNNSWNRIYEIGEVRIASVGLLENNLSLYYYPKSSIRKATIEEIIAHFSDKVQQSEKIRASKNFKPVHKEEKKLIGWKVIKRFPGVDDTKWEFWKTNTELKGWSFSKDSNNEKEYNPQKYPEYFSPVYEEKKLVDNKEQNLVWYDRKERVWRISKDALTDEEMEKLVFAYGMKKVDLELEKKRSEMMCYGVFSIIP